MFVAEADAILGTQIAKKWKPLPVDNVGATSTTVTGVTSMTVTGAPAVAANASEGAGAVGGVGESGKRGRRSTKAESLKPAKKQRGSDAEHVAEEAALPAASSDSD